MNILVIAYSLNSAGGKNVLLNFLDNLDQYSDFFYIVVSHSFDVEKYAHIENVRFIWLNDYLISPIGRFYTDYYKIPSIVRNIKPDRIFSMINFAMPLRKVKQALLFHNAYYVYDDFSFLLDKYSFATRLNFAFQTYLFKNRLKYADVIFVQTQVIKNRLQHRTNCPIEIIPNSIQKSSSNPYELNLNKEENIHYLLCLSKYYIHKNLEILLDVARSIQVESLPYKIVLTLNPMDSGARGFLNKVELNNLDNVIINIGEIPQDSVKSIFIQLDGLILPTLLESFSATYIECMECNRPIFTSNLDFAKEVCGDYANYFDPTSSESIIHSLNSYYQIQNADQKPRKTDMQYLNSKDTTRLFIEKLKNI